MIVVYWFAWLYARAKTGIRVSFISFLAQMGYKRKR
jgi:hypothetical protein